jgi:hypothetical protein
MGPISCVYVCIYIFCGCTCLGGRTVEGRVGPSRTLLVLQADVHIHSYLSWVGGGGVEGEGWGTRCPGVVDILSPCHTWDGLELIPTSTPTNFAFVLALICVCTVLGSVVVGE